MKTSILILTLGGTIAMTRDSPDNDAGVKPSLTGEMLVAAVPQLLDVASIEVQSFRQLPGAHLQFEDIEALATKIQDAHRLGVRGFVVVQGTDTIEETAFALDRLLDIDAPVVVTGAMRNPSVLSADGPANLMAAVQVAASALARDLGCLVVMNDEIHAARFVRKTHTSNLTAFSSPNTGPLGWVAERRVRIVTRVARVPAIRASGIDAAGTCEGRVVLLTAGLGDDGKAAELLRNSFDGMVIQATGGGHVSPTMADALERAAMQVPVILASRSPAGEMLSSTYGFAGGEIDLQRRGLIRSGWLDGVKSRVLLALLLRGGCSARPLIASSFEPWGALD